MTRREQIEEAAELFNGFGPSRKCFIRGAEWADAHPDLISRQGAIKNTIEWHANRVKTLENQLAIAVEALKHIENNCGCPRPEDCYDKACDALAKIESMK